MIKLQSGSILLRTPDGDQEFLDLDALHDDLWASCQAVGIEDPEMPDDILGVVCAFVDRGVQLTAADIDAMVLQILCDSGMRALADEYAKRRHASASVVNPEEMISPAPDLVAELLREQPFFLGTPIEKLTNLVLVQLGKLGFTECNRRFIVELARNSWHHLRTHAEEPKERGLWLIHRREFAGILSGKAGQLVAADVLQLLSISALFPAIQARLDLYQLARTLGPGLLPELQFYPAVEEACHAFCNACKAIEAEARQRRPDLDTPLPGRVEFRGLKALVQEYLENSRKEELELRQALGDVIEQAFKEAQLQTALR